MQHMVGHTAFYFGTYTVHTALYCAVARKASLHTRMESADVEAGVSMLVKDIQCIGLR